MDVPVDDGSGRCSRGGGGISPFRRVSVIIVNYNYEKYVGEAIESALALRWNDVEVVVIDDGSTDSSVTVIERYRDRVRTLYTENATQRVAANRGYAMTTGDVVIFLDSDDFLPPDLPLRLVEVWGPGVSKAQFQMQRVDSQGTPSGDPFPDYRSVPASGDIRRWMSTTSAYPTPPGSGNAYSRAFLDRIFPVGSEVGNASDSACLAAAPLLGDVVCVPGVVVGYRRHGANDSNLLADHQRFAREVERARSRWRFAQVASGVAEDRVDEAPLFRSRELLQLRIAASRVAVGGSPLPGDSRARMFLDAVASPFRAGPEGARRRLMVAAWSMVTLVAPPGAVRQLLSLRYERS